jgi:hypothetical protein
MATLRQGISLTLILLPSLWSLPAEDVYIMYAFLNSPLKLNFSLIYIYKHTNGYTCVLHGAYSNNPQIS